MRRTTVPHSLITLLAFLTTWAIASVTSAQAQTVRVRDLTIQEQAVPVRLVGYGIVTGLNGTGDRSSGGSGPTVQSVANLLRRFGVEVPAEALRMRNAAAVLVTAEASPYLRPGGRFDVSVSSLGDARSLEGGVLWATPLTSGPGEDPTATAQGPLLVAKSNDRTQRVQTTNTARVPQGGLLEIPLPKPAYTSANRLLLKEPDLIAARRITDAINQAVGQGTAQVEDPGSVALTLPQDPAERTTALVQIQELPITSVNTPKILIDSRDGTVVASGSITIGPAVVSHGLITLAVGDANGAPADGLVRLPEGTTAQAIAAALQAVRTPAKEIAAIFQALNEVGAMRAEIVIR